MENLSIGGYRKERLNGYKIVNVCDHKNFLNAVKKMGCNPNIAISDPYSDTFIWVDKNDFEKVEFTPPKYDEEESTDTNLFIPKFDPEKRIFDAWQINYANSHVKTPSNYFLS